MSNLALTFIFLNFIFPIFAIPAYGSAQTQQTQAYNPKDLLTRSAAALAQSKNFKTTQEQLKIIATTVAADIASQEKLNKEEGHPSEDALYRFEIKLRDLLAIKKENSENKCSELKFKFNKDLTSEWDSKESLKWLEALCKE